MSDIETPEENSVVETPSEGEIIEIPNPDIPGGTEVWYSSGRRADNDLEPAIKSFLGISRSKSKDGHVSGFLVTDKWRYPGEKEWRR